MSTILKALRRLENDDPKKKRTGAPPVLRDAPTPAPLPPTDPRAVDALRGRILAEEAAARVVANLRDESHPGTSRVRTILLRTLAATLAVAALVFAFTKTGFYTPGEPDPASPIAARESMPPVAPAPVASPSAPPSPPPAAPRAMVAVPNPLAPADPAFIASPPTPAPAPMPTAPAPIAAPPPSVAVAPPTQIAENARAIPPAQPARAAQVAPPPPIQPTQSARVTPAAQPAPPAPVAQQPTPAMPTRVAAPAPIPPAPPAPTIQAAPQMTPKAAPVAAPIARPTPTDVAATSSSATFPAPSSTPESAPAPRADVKRVAPAGLPEVKVVRTAWHPKPERRSAKVRIVETDELVTVREGDTVAGLVLQEITPSAVVFSAGDVEIRRRVGEASASR